MALPRCLFRLLLHDTGLGRWRGGWRDAHFRVALGAALPAWALLAAGFGAHMRAPQGGAAWLGFTLLGPLLEELLFRGLLQGQLLRLTNRRRAGGLTLANGLTTVAFVAAHFATQPTGWALAVVLPSLVLGHLRERMRSVWPAVMVHAVYNLGFALAAWGVHR